MTHPLKAVPVLSLAEHAYQSIRQLIFDFALMPGDRFSESELSQRVQVSRTPLRQALQRLEREGFLQVFPKLGWQVAPLDFDQFDELYDLRILIECHAAQALCEAEPREALQALAAQWLVPASERSADADAVREMDEQFHCSLVQAAGNREMARVHREITDRIRIVRRLDFTKPARIAATYDEHARILGAITRRRAEEALRLLRAHVEQSKLEVRHITLDMLYRARQQA
ncbi:GntR family transcriptional regulator [Azohydromonas aeria]|uniref:GntR family transcriptional regulator n=1 Tax=Azohydromonas aeria TaxID=2590212 RepID=UPI001E48ED77|nr:GntR family transcriptional regulator [Azohydromonas aeria]